jgi:hypothetical protein
MLRFSRRMRRMECIAGIWPCQESGQDRFFLSARRYPGYYANESSHKRYRSEL